MAGIYRHAAQNEAENPGVFFAFFFLDVFINIKKIIFSLYREICW